jgi:hypothetical protein
MSKYYGLSSALETVSTTLLHVNLLRLVAIFYIINYIVVVYMRYIHVLSQLSISRRTRSRDSVRASIPLHRPVDVERWSRTVILLTSLKYLGRKNGRHTFLKSLNSIDAGFFCIPSRVYEGSAEFSQRGREQTLTPTLVKLCVFVGQVGTSSSVNHVVTN